MINSFKQALTGSALRPATTQRKTARVGFVQIMARAGSKKVNSYDEDWQKGFFGTGIFLEDREASSKSPFRQIEEKGLLSAVEKAGILSKLEAAGFTLSKIEQSRLLSTAERLGLLSVAEDLLTSNPATIASGSIPFIVLSIAALVFVPHDNAVSAVLSYTASAMFAGVATAALAGGFIVAAIQED